MARGLSHKESEREKKDMQLCSGKTRREKGEGSNRKEWLRRDSFAYSCNGGPSIGASSCFRCFSSQEASLSSYFAFLGPPSG